MPVTLRKRPQCHYCGKRLNTTKREGDRIPCDQCSADNYFDQHNNIIDVPDTEVNRSNSQLNLLEIESESDTFCRKCLTNQAFYVEALANYLPDETHPQYEQLLADLPEYKKSLELRYPQCCADCEPRAASRIQDANYMAKSDHLRRLMHRKHDRSRSTQFGFPSLLISATGLGHGLSLGIQLLWHALSSQANSEQIIPGITPTQCLLRWPVSAQCTRYISSLLPISLFVGLLCVWWNPKWQHRLRGTEGRLVGLARYYQIQLALMGLRLFAWAILHDLPILQHQLHAAHTVLFLILSTTSIYAVTSVVKVDNTPLVDWQQVQPPLVKPEQFRVPAQQVPSPPSSQLTSSFNIADLAGPSNSVYEPWRPPTPPNEDDSMDWAPTVHTFKPQPRAPKAKFQQQNPFYGTLPAAPIRGSLDPKAQPPPQKKALGLPPGFFGLSKSRDGDQKLIAPPKNASDSFRPSNFFVSTQSADTGLESIFDKMFSVRDPHETSNISREHGMAASSTSNQPQGTYGRRRRSRSQSRDGRQNSVKPSWRLILSCTVIVMLVVVALKLISEPPHGVVTDIGSSILPYLVGVPLLHLFEEALYTGQLDTTTLIISALLSALAVLNRALADGRQSKSASTWNNIALATTGLLTLFEIYRFCQLQIELLPTQAPPPAATPEPSGQQTQPVQDQLTQIAESQLQMQQQPIQSQVMQASRSPFQHGDFGTIRKRDSDESISSVSSINTTSTASGWKTPQNTGRTFDWQQHSRNTPRNRSSNSALGLGSLSLGNDFGSGAMIAGPRNRQIQNNGVNRNRGW